MDKATYMEFLESRPKFLELTDEEVRSWTDQICNNIHALEASIYNLSFGKYDPILERYENRISICGMSCKIFNFPDVNLFEGIEKLARATGSKLELFHYPDVQFPFRYSFRYKGVKFYQLAKEEIWEEQA